MSCRTTRNNNRVKESMKKVKGYKIRLAASNVLITLSHSRTWGKADWCDSLGSVGGVNVGPHVKPADNPQLQAASWVITCLWENMQCRICCTRRRGGGQTHEWAGRAKKLCGAISGAVGDLWPPFNPVERLFRRVDTRIFEKLNSELQLKWSSSWQ